MILVSLSEVGMHGTFKSGHSENPSGSSAGAFQGLTPFFRDFRLRHWYSEVTVQYFSSAVTISIFI